MGVVGRSSDVVLPSPCVRRDETMRAVLSRPTRMRAAARAPGFLLLAEGSLRDTFRADTAALLDFSRRPPTAAPAPWSSRNPLVAHDEDSGRWLITGRRNASLVLSRGDVSDEITHSGAAVDLQCLQGRCSLLAARDHRDKARGGADLWQGRSADPISAWSHSTLDAPRNRTWTPVAVAALDAIPTVAVQDDLQVTLWRAPAGGAAQRVAGLRAPYGTFDVQRVTWKRDAPPRWTAATRTAVPRRCSSEAGGVNIVSVGAPTTRLRSAAPAVRSTLRPLEVGALALWLAPTNCGASHQLLYGAVLGSGGVAVAPVAALADTEDYAIASRGNDVDLWLRSARSLTWVRLRCDVSGPRP